MREVKFKLWHKGLKKFFTTYYSDQISMMPDGNIFWMGECETDNFILLQYTGLKDKNGKEIYEGDIVRCYGGAYWNGVYEYNYIIEVKDIRDLNEIVHSENVEILGNKYENPELLEVEGK